MIAIVVGNGMVWTSVIVSFSYLVVLHGGGGWFDGGVWGPVVV